jgi:hypothetical protein
MDQIEGTRLAADTCRMAKKPNRRNLKNYKLAPRSRSAWHRRGRRHREGSTCRLIGCRKVEITLDDLSGNGLGQFCAAGVLWATPLTYSMQRDHSDFVVFCFSNSEDGGFCQALRWRANRAGDSESKRGRPDHLICVKGHVIGSI